jgi:hypothetical protein
MRNLSILLLFLAVLIFPIGVEAKVLPQSKGSSVKTAVKSTGSTIGVYPKLAPNRKSITVNFTNLQNAKAVSYLLIYKTSTQEEAAGGALNLKGQTSDKIDIQFATCSNGVCRFHVGVRDARLEVSYTSVNGKKYLKKFKIRV